MPTPGCAPSCSRSRCGAGRRSTRRCGSSRNAPGSGWPSCASGFPTSCFRCCCGRRTPSGYTNYPDNVVQGVRARKRPQAGIDLFRIFDSLNWVPNMRVAMEAVRESGAHLRSGHLLHRRHPRSEAAEVRPEVLRRAGQGAGEDGRPHAGHQGHGRPVQAVRGRAAGRSTLKQEIGIPIHFHTHDTSGVQAGGDPQGGRSGPRHRRRRDRVDVGPDLAAEPERDRRGAAVHAARHAASTSSTCSRWPDYWEAVREFYAPFETGMMASTADVYHHEMPGGQYTNLYRAGPGAGPGRRAGPRSAACTPRSISCSATSSRSRRRRRPSATWRCSWSPTT